MERTEIFEKLNEIFVDVMDNDNINLTESTTANDIDEWDSLTQIQLVVAIEKTFGIKFTAAEITSWPDVGAMVDCIQRK
jgi:acyl carrier protein